MQINNVVLGGATLFPKLQLTVQPKQGNALIWYNQNKEGRTDKLAEHAVCPVVIGSRWGEFVSHLYKHLIL